MFFINLQRNMHLLHINGEVRVDTRIALSNERLLL